MVVEIGIDVDETELTTIAKILEGLQIPYYIEPFRDYKTLEELTIDCEGK